MSRTRPSVLAGEWYPDDPVELRALIRGAMEKAPGLNVAGRIVGLISPHAGYAYSGFTAAHGYKLLSGKAYDVVVLISPYHSTPAGKYMIHSADAYETPLGQVPVARELVEQLASEIAVTELPRESEHSIEIQLPFLQTVLKNFSIIPIMVGSPDVWNVDDLVRPLVELLKGRNALLIASSDLHHLHSYGDLKKEDSRVAEALARFDLDGIRSVLEPDFCTVCGKVPISIVTEAAKKMGADMLKVLYRSNSKDEFSGEYSGTYTVGYLSAVMTGK